MVAITRFCYSFVTFNHNFRKVYVQKENINTVFLPSPPLWSTPVGITSSQFSSKRVQRIKDISIKRQILSDVIASEFALKVELKTESKEIDFDMLIAKLEQNINILKNREFIKNENDLLDRILKTKEDLTLMKAGLRPKYYESPSIENSSKNELNSFTNSVNVNTSEDINSSLLDSSENNNNNINSIKALREKVNLTIIVREDGTVDWDGALASGKEVAKFGTELWERLNGKEEAEGIPSISELFAQVKAKEPQTQTIEALNKSLSHAQDILNNAVASKETLTEVIRQERRENIETKPDNILQLLRLDLRVKELQKLTKIIKLNLDIERICVYLEQEIESSIDPTEQRQFIAEVALVDKEYSSLISDISVQGMNVISEFGNNIITTDELETDSLGSGATTPLYSLHSTVENLVSLIDDDELNLVIGEVNDLLGRLGLQTQVAPSMDWGSLGVVVTNNIDKIKEGLGFYGEGTKMLVADCQYAWQLLFKALQGTTLKPREVNTLRRTGKDILTLIPFTIILIIPLTPIGHVLVFSFIQRFFPDFFPSCYTEKRLNLRKLFSEIERKTDGSSIDDILGSSSSSDSRATSSNAYFFANSMDNISNSFVKVLNAAGDFTGLNGKVTEKNTNIE